MKILTKVQNELKVPKTQYNSFGKYKYRTVEDIQNNLKPLLEKHKVVLSISDEVVEVGGFLFVKATVTMTDGKESIKSVALAGIEPNKKGMDFAQSCGASSSYARKYALGGMFLLDDQKDSDSIEKPIKNKPEMTTTHRKYDAMLKSLQEGKTNLAEVEKVFFISPKTKKEIMKKITL